MVETGQVTSLVAPGIFRWFGRNVINIQPIDAVPAMVPSTWTLSDNAGHTIKAGTAVSLQKSGDENLFFAVQTDVVVAPGATTTAGGEVVLVAIVDGVNGNGISPGPATLIESLAWVDGVITTMTTSGGVEPELDDAYLNRLSRDLQLLSPTPTLAEDFEVMAANVAGVGRAHAVDGYNPADSTYDNERMVTVALTDASGVAVGSPIKAAVKAYLESPARGQLHRERDGPEHTEHRRHSDGAQGCCCQLRHGARRVRGCSAGLPRPGELELEWHRPSQRDHLGARSRGRR